MIPMRRRLVALAILSFLAGCAGSSEQVAMRQVEPLGAFKLGYVVVVADNAQKVQPSRNVTEAEWENAMKAALERRFKPLAGDQFYHVAVAVRGYSVAVPGVPVVMSPKSVIVVEANVWDDAKQAKINEKPKQFVVLESVSPDTVIGSGLTKSKSEQVANLSANAARQIEDWMRDHPEWFAKRN
ncbi:hypothetical protein [Tropicimonas sp.]|uniref:hypothetical protein n=1 Tax=Tropicimonas sp. TaxID=2067044 RepID=UPI003A87ACA6